MTPSDPVFADKQAVSSPGTSFLHGMVGRYFSDQAWGCFAAGGCSILTAILGGSLDAYRHQFSKTSGKQSLLNDVLACLSMSVRACVVSFTEQRARCYGLAYPFF